MSDSTLRKCLHVLRSAQSDNERFAALMMVTKVIRGEDCDDETRREILEAMGFRFLTRLMKTTSVPEGCPTSIYKSIALSILSSFTRDPIVVSNPEIKKQVTVLNEIILGHFRDEEEDTSTGSMLSDCYDCLRGMLLSPVSRSYLIEGGAQQALVEVIVSKTTEWEKACEVLIDLLRRERSNVWAKRPGDAQKLLRGLVADFTHKQDATKFEIGEIVTVVLSTVEQKESDPQQPWVKDLAKELNNIIRSKLDDKLRDCTLCLIAALVSSQGMTCILPPCAEDMKLLLLVTHMACIEVRMVLEDGRLEQIQKKSGVVCSCYSLLENLIGHMTNGASMALNEKQIVQLHSAMMGAFNSVIYFLSQVEQQQIEMARTSLLVTASVRVLGSWLAEETSALKEEVYKLLPFLMQICKQQIYKETEDTNTLPDLGLLSIDGPEKQDGQTGGQEEKDAAGRPVSEQGGQTDRMTDIPSGTPVGESVVSSENMDCNSDMKDGSISNESAKCHNDAQPMDVDGERSRNRDEQKLDGLSKASGSNEGPSVSSEHSQNQDEQTDRKSQNSSSPETDNVHKDGMKDSQKDGQSNACDAAVVPDQMDTNTPKSSGTKSQKSVHFDGVGDSSNASVDAETGKSSDTKSQKSVHFDGASDAAPKEESLIVNRCDGVDLVKFLLPAICHLSAEDKPREILLRENMHILLVDYFQRQMTDFLEHRVEGDIGDTLASLCGIFLNLSVTEPAFVSTQHKFHELLSSVLFYVTKTAGNPNLLILTANFVTLGLMLLRQQKARTDITNESRDQFLAGSISFLSKAHSRVKRKPPMMAVSEPYKAEWEDISELWYLSMQEINAFVPQLSDLNKLIMKSGWVPAIIRILLEVQGAGVDPDSQSAFLSMLTTLALNDTSAKRVIKEKRGIELAQMYLCEDLKNALTTS